LIGVILDSTFLVESLLFNFIEFRYLFDSDVPLIKNEILFLIIWSRDTIFVLIMDIITNGANDMPAYIRSVVAKYTMVAKKNPMVIRRTCLIETLPIGKAMAFWFSIEKFSKTTSSFCSITSSSHFA